MKQERGGESALGKQVLSQGRSVQTPLLDTRNARTRIGEKKTKFLLTVENGSGEGKGKV